MIDTQKKELINIEEVIRNKNPKLLKFLPGFILRYIKRIVHQDHINAFIQRHGEKTSFAFVDQIINEFGVKVTFEGLENIPTSGGAIVAANHPIGALDAMALLNVIGKKRLDQKFIVNDVLLSLKNLSNLFIGVNKHGKNSGQALDLIDSYYASDTLVLIFPAGLVSRKQKGGIVKDLVWKKSFISKAKRFNKNIIPVHISGSNSNFFYNLALWRQRLGIKANIEMFYLMDEMYHQKGKLIHIKIGKPIDPSLFKAEFTDIEWAEKVKEYIYEMANGNSSAFNVTN